MSNISIDRKHIIGHDECYTSKTDGAGCPGRNLFAQLGAIVEKANWYKNSSADVIDKPPKLYDVNVDAAKVTSLASKYEELVVSN